MKNRKSKRMNAVTKQWLKQGFKPPTYVNTSPVGMPEVFKKVDKGVPYVNYRRFL